MPTIPSGDKIVFTSADVELKERKSARINAQSQVYTMQDITDTVNAGGSGPTSLFDLDDASKNTSNPAAGFQIGSTSTALFPDGVATGDNIFIQNNDYGSGIETFRTENSTVIGNAAGGTSTPFTSSSFNGRDTTAIGYGSLLNFGNTSNPVLAFASEGNTALGLVAGYGLKQGKHNTFLGAYTGLGYNQGSSAASGNVTLIGYNADASSPTVTNEITLGNSSITALRCAVTSITSLSDERDKKDIVDLEYGLDFIESLQPKQFTWDNRPEKTIEVDKDGNEIEKEIESANKGKKDFGFIAQEVQSLDNDVLRLVYDENPDKLEMSYGKLVPILVKAVKELSEKVKALEAN